MAKKKTSKKKTTKKDEWVSDYRDLKKITGIKKSVKIKTKDGIQGGVQFKGVKK